MSPNLMQRNLNHANINSASLKRMSDWSGALEKKRLIGEGVWKLLFSAQPPVGQTKDGARENKTSLLSFIRYGTGLA